MFFNILQTPVQGLHYEHVMQILLILNTQFLIKILLRVYSGHSAKYKFKVMN